MMKNKLAQYDLLSVFFTRKDKKNLDKIHKLRNLFKELNHASRLGFDSLIKCSNKKPQRPLRPSSVSTNLLLIRITSSSLYLWDRCCLFVTCKVSLPDPSWKGKTDKHIKEPAQGRKITGQGANLLTNSFPDVSSRTITHLHLSMENTQTGPALHHNSRAEFRKKRSYLLCRGIRWVVLMRFLLLTDNWPLDHPESVLSCLKCAQMELVWAAQQSLI